MSEISGDNVEELAIEEEFVVPPEGVQRSRVYFHTFERGTFNPELGVISQNDLENVTDFMAWSLYFPYEKIGNNWTRDRSTRRVVTLVDEEGRPNFSMMVLDEESGVKRITRRYKRAYVGRDYLDQIDVPKGVLGLESEYDATKIDKKHFVAEVPITRELQEKMTLFKTDLALIKLSEDGLADKIFEYFSGLEAKVLPVLQGEHTMRELADLMASGLIRDYALRFLPALVSMSRETEDLSKKQLTQLWHAVSGVFESASLRRYCGSMMSQLEKEGRIDLGVYEEVGEGKVCDDVDGVGLLKMLAGINSKRKKYLANAGDAKFFGYYLSTSEITFWAVRGGHDYLLEERGRIGLEVVTKLEQSDDPLEVLMLAESLEVGLGQDKRILGLKPWAVEQMKEEPNEEVGDFERMEREETIKAEIWKQRVYWERDAKTDNGGQRRSRLGFVRRELVKHFLSGKIQGVEAKRMAQSFYEYLVGKPVSDTEANIDAMRALNLMDEGGYGELLVNLLEADGEKVINVEEHLDVLRKMIENNHPYLAMVKDGSVKVGAAV